MHVGDNKVGLVLFSSGLDVLFDDLDSQWSDTGSCSSRFVMLRPEAVVTEQRDSKTISNQHKRLPSRMQIPPTSEIRNLSTLKFLQFTDKPFRTVIHGVIVGQADSGEMLLEKRQCFFRTMEYITLVFQLSFVRDDAFQITHGNVHRLKIGCKFGKRIDPVVNGIAWIAI